MTSVTRRSVLSNRTYRYLFGAQLIALLGTGLLTVALSLLAFDVAPSAAGEVVATALTIKMVAYVGVAPFVAAAVSRMAPRTVLLSANVIRGLVAVSLPWVDQVWQIYVLIFVLQAASATFTPAFQAVIPAVLEDEDEYTRALSLSRLAYDMESVVSPIVSAALLLIISFHGLFIGTAVGFVASAALVASSGLGRQGTVEETTSFWARATQGIVLFVKRPALRALLALDLAVAAVTALVLVNTVVVVRQDMGLGDTSVAVALAAYGAGSMVVALSVPAILRRLPDRLVMLSGGALAPVSLAVAAISTSSAGSFAAVLVAWFVIGASISMMLTPSGRIINRSVTPGERPAAFAANFSMSHAFFLASYPIAGWAGSALGVPGAALVLGAIAVVAVGAAVVLWRTADDQQASSTASVRAG
jgi:MFS family permease